MRFTFSRPAGAAAPAQPGRILLDRCDFLDLYQTAPDLCRAELDTVSRMFGCFYRAEADWCARELDDAARLLRLEKGARSLVLSVQHGPEGARVVYDAE